MALQTSGPISFANLQSEFGGSNPITMGEYAAFRVSGSGNTISMNQFYGASSSETQTVTVGTYFDAGAYVQSTSWGFGLNLGGGFGSVSDGTLGVTGNSTLSLMTWNSLIPTVQLQVLGTVANSGWTTMTVAGTAFTRASATFSQNTTLTPYTTAWTWGDPNNPIANPYGTTVGATKQVVFT